MSSVNGGSAVFRHLAHGVWKRLDFWLGLLTTALVALAWVISLVSRPQAAAFGGSVALLGMGVASINYVRRGRPPLAVAYTPDRLPGSVLAVLAPHDPQNTGVIEAAISDARGKPVVFLYLGEQRPHRIPRPFEIVDPYLEDLAARATLSKAEKLARQAGIPRRFVYQRPENTQTASVWRIVQPRDVVLSAEMATQMQDINPDRIRYQFTPYGKIAHLLKHW
jgi:hypothetical protein